MRRLESGRIQVRYRDPGGRERSFTAETVTEARRRQAEVRADLSRGKWRDPAGLRRPFIEWATIWRQAWGARATTTAAADVRLKRYVYPKWRNWQLGAIDRVAIQTWVNELARTELSPATVVAIFNLLRSILKAAVDAELIPSNPAVRVKLPPVGTRDGRVLSPEEAAALIARFNDQRAAALTLLTLGGGLRWGEGAGLHRRSVDTEQSRLWIVEALHEARGKLWFEAPKSTSSVREVPIPAPLISSLQLPSEPDALLFPNATGGPLRRSDFRRRVWVPAKANVAPELRWHELRKTYASWLEDGGIPRITIAELLGHRVVAETGEPVVTTRYIYSVPGVGDRVMKVLSEALGPAVAAYRQRW